MQLARKDGIVARRWFFVLGVGGEYEHEQGQGSYGCGGEEGQAILPVAGDEGGEMGGELPLLGAAVVSLLDGQFRYSDGSMGWVTLSHKRSLLHESDSST